ncbi:ASKHA domain-containing protein [Thermogladius sp. 4427co]|uniref:ASKHA domain-containing protein n=1 Tax=Thermogladius sp. 4427co TaxID=3450718 RepID=UPI003F78B003
MVEIKVYIGDKVLKGSAGDNLGDILARERLIPLPCGGRGICGLCRIRIIEGEVSPPSKYERMFGYTGSIRLACQTRVYSDVKIELMPGISKPVKRETLDITPRVLNPLLKSLGEGFIEIPGYRLGVKTIAGRFLLVDIGTTKTAYQVVKYDGSTLYEDAVFTPLMEYGSDIITRLTKALEKDSVREEMSSRLRDLVKDIATRHGAEAALVAGNSVMESIFFNLPLESLAEYPFNPPVKGPVATYIGDMPVIGLPMIEGFLGGDAYADLIASLELNLDTPYLLIDLGTCAEVFIVDSGVIYATSTPSGPAFETGITRGSMIFQGGVYDIRLVKIESGKPVFEYKYYGQPSGILGPALITLLSELKRHGIIDVTGRIIKNLASIHGGVKAIPIDESEGLYITQTDIRELQKAIAAVKSAIRVLLREAGLASNDLKNVIVAGNFGANLKISDAIEVGLLPSVDEDKVLPVGNMVLPGLKVSLMNGDYIVNYREVEGKIKFIDLPRTKNYMEIWADSLKLTSL